MGSRSSNAGMPFATSGWQTKSFILNNYHIGHRHLEKWAANGFVRTAKLDERQQGRRIYAVADVSATILAISEGREPQRVAGRGCGI